MDTGLFLGFDSYEQHCRNIWVPGFVWTSIIISSGLIPWSGIAGVHGRCMIDVKKAAKLFSKVAIPFRLSRAMF